MARAQVAARAALASLEPSSRQAVRVPVHLIDVVDRLRDIDWDWAAALLVSIKREGLITPIEVQPAGDRFRLVLGAHRWGAHKIGELEFIDAYVVDAEWAEARAREIAENIQRRELSALDRAAFIAELYEVEKVRQGWKEDQSQQQFAAGKRWAKDASATLAPASGLSETVAEKVGLSRRALFRDLALHRTLRPELARALIERGQGDTPAAQLRALSKLSPEQQGQVADRMRGADLVLKDAWAKVAPKVQPNPEDKRLSAFVGAWSRMGAAERKGALATLFQLFTPGERKALRSMLSGEAADA